MDQRTLKHQHVRSLERDNEKLKNLILTESTFVLLSQIINDVKDHPSVCETVTEKIVQFSLERFNDTYNSELLDLISQKTPPRLPPRSILSPSSSSAVGGARRKTNSVSFPEVSQEVVRSDGATALRNWQARRHLDQEPEEEYCSPYTTYW